MIKLDEKFEYLQDLHIVDLVVEWFYEKELHQKVEEMFFEYKVDLCFYRESLGKNRNIENYLFQKLKNEYGIKKPYENIPYELEYVLNIVK